MSDIQHLMEGRDSQIINTYATVQRYLQQQFLEAKWASSQQTICHLWI